MTDHIPAGWMFCTADFSVIAAGGTIPGSVTLVRDKTSKAAWHAMPEELKEGVDGPPLYTYGCGMTLAAAMQDAIKNALAAQPIPTTEGKP